MDSHNQTTIQTSGDSKTQYGKGRERETLESYMTSNLVSKNGKAVNNKKSNWVDYVMYSRWTHYH